MEGAVQHLAEVFNSTLTPDRATLQRAEAELRAASQQPNYGITILQLLNVDAVALAVRQAAAVHFKNHIKFHWAPSDADAYSGARAMPDSEKDQIKHYLIGLMLRAPAPVRAQLSEALAIISSHDFPHKWGPLLPELVERLNTDDPSIINGVLETANSVFKRYRGQYSDNQLVAELDQSQQIFAPTLLATQAKLSSMIPAAEADPAALKLVLSCVRLAFRIYFSLNSPGLTPLMEEQLDPWMAEFDKYLKYSHPSLEEADAEKESCADAVRSAACQNINLFMEMNEEEFAKYLQTFVTDVWGLLVNVSIRPGQDNLVMAAIRFLTTVARSVHHTLFRDAAALVQICEAIVIPNLRVRDEDEEMFDMNAVEYIRRDVEGSDNDTRRRAAADLVRALTEKFPQEVTTLFTSYVQAMLAEYAANPATAWKSKDCAVYLVIALAVRGRTAAAGATTTNALVNIQDFYTSQVLPELQAADVNSSPILKADALKFVTTFRTHLPKAAALALFPALTNLLAAESFVVHSYAATAIDKFLVLKDNNQPRFAPADLTAQLEPMLTRLFGVLQMPESAENEYAMRAILRVISFVGPTIAPVVPSCLQALATTLQAVAKNPRSPGFNHYLFESVAALIKHGTAGNPAAITTYEEMLFPAFNIVLQQDVQEFHPYVFQIFTQLIDLRPTPIPATYLQIFPPLLTPVFWERSGSIPALVPLVQAYLAKTAAEVVAGGHLMPLLGVFQKLVASRVHDHHGFHLANSMVLHLPLAAYQQYLPEIFRILFMRMQASRTPKFVRGFLVLVGLLIAKHGPVTVAENVDKVQGGMFTMLLQQIWCPNLASVEGNPDLKVVIVATTNCLTDSPAVQQNAPLRDALRAALAAKLQGEPAAPEAQQAAAAAAEEEQDFEASGGYSAAFAKLVNAARPERDPLPDVADARQYAQQRLQ